MSKPEIDFSNAVRGALNGSALVVTIDNPPVNATGVDVRAGLQAAIAHANDDAAIAAIIITGAGKIFIGGADIREFGQPAREPSLPDTINAIEASQKPVVAALNGAALGGGLEVALAAHARIAAPQAQMALPEVKLGVVPGAGGTQRLPRLIGAIAALDIITSGRNVAAEEALQLGLVDAIAADDLVQDAIALALSLTGKPLRRLSEMTTPGCDAAAFANAMQQAIKKARTATAPKEAARLVELALTASFQAGIAEERRTFQQLRDSEESAALRHLFFAERSAGKVDGLSAQPRPLTKIAIAGLGLMGSGIAAACLAAGYQLIGFERSAEAALAGKARITDLINKAVSLGKLQQAAADAQLAQLTTTDELGQLADADLVIEAVFDDFAVKSALFRELDQVLQPQAILATNTSYLNPDELAAVTTRADRVVGLHFFSPANIMRLVEVVRCGQTSDEVLATAIAFAKKIRKLPIVTGVGEGFVGNRIFSAYRSEAELLLAEGAYPEQIDRAMENYGFAMGLFAVNDLAGLEIAWARRKRMAADRDPNELYVDVPDQLCELGRFGRKTGRGWYIYQDGKRQDDPEVRALIDAFRTRHSITPQTFSEAAIMDRLLTVMARTGQQLIADRIARNGDDIDLVLTNGYGFPTAKGGPMFATRNRQN